MFTRFSRSWALAKASGELLMADRKLLVFPLLSGLCTLVVCASFVLPVLAAAGLFRHGGGSHGVPTDGIFYLAAFVFYLVQYTVIFFFNTALVGAAMMRMDGGEPTLGDGLKLAVSRLPQILGYAAIAATVGMLLRALQERLGLVGRLIAGLLGLAWTVATFLVVPVLAATGTGPVEAIKRSTALLKRTWGENIIGNAGIGLVFGLATFLWVALMMTVAVAAGGLQSPAMLVTAVAIGVLGLIALGLVQSALQGVYAAALYRYAEYGDAGNGFQPALLEQAFRAKG